MFFFLSKTLNILLNPLVWILVLLLLALLNRYRRKFYLTTATLTFLILSNPFISNLFMGWLEYPQKPVEKAYKIGVVLTGMIDPFVKTEQQVAFSGGADRFTETLRLYHLGYIEKILISGGSGLLLDKNFSESPQLGELAAILGVLPGDLILESNSRNTYENAKFTSPILKELSGNEEVLLITSAFHMRRAVACFRKQGINVVPYPVDFRSSKVVVDYNLWIPGSGAIDGWKIIVKELAGMVAYKMAGYT